MQRRLRWASDPLLRSTIGQSLPDRQAELLLNWGLRQMARSVRATADQSEAHARMRIRADLHLVRKIMRRMQYLIERRTLLDEADVAAQLAVIAALSRQLPQRDAARSRAARPSPRPSMFRAARQAVKLDSQRWLSRLVRFADASRSAPTR